MESLSEEKPKTDKAMTRTLLAALALAALTGPGLAQATPESQPLRLRVSPSGHDPVQSEARERQERLLRRLEKSDYMMRSICIHCGDAWKHQIYAPFNPLDSLRASSKTAEERSN